MCKLLFLFCIPYSFAGKIGITLNFAWHEPKNLNNPNDLVASEIGNQFELGQYANPVYVNGDYPDVMKYKIGNKSLHLNYSRSRLPEFTDHEKNFIKGKFTHIN